MLKGRDIIVLAKLSVDRRRWTINALADELQLPPAGVQRSLSRLERAGIYFPSRKVVAISLARELIVSAVKFLYPPNLLGEALGVPTAWSASPLRERLVVAEKTIEYVWAHQDGSVRGIALEPLDPQVPAIALRDPDLGELLALIDALRIGGARDRAVATALIDDRLGTGRKAAA